MGPYPRLCIIHQALNNAMLSLLDSSEVEHLRVSWKVQGKSPCLEVTYLTAKEELIPGEDGMLSTLKATPNCCLVDHNMLNCHLHPCSRLIVITNQQLEASALQASISQEIMTSSFQPPETQNKQTTLYEGTLAMMSISHVDLCLPGSVSYATEHCVMDMSQLKRATTGEMNLQHLNMNVLHFPDFKGCSYTDAGLPLIIILGQSEKWREVGRRGCKNY